MSGIFYLSLLANGIVALIVGVYLLRGLPVEPKTIPSPGHDSCAVENHNTKSLVTDLWKSYKNLLAMTYCL